MAPVALSGCCPSWMARVSKCIARMLLTSLRAEPGTEARERLVGARRVAPRAQDLELVRRAVEARLDAAHDAVADENGEDVVAVLALRLRDVHLEPVAEVEERLGAIAVVDEPIERGQEGDPVRNRVGTDFGMRLPSTRTEPHPESSEAPF